jgi:hypothetical protein
MGPDFSVACIRYASGVQARLTCSIVASADHSMHIFGENGTLSIEDCWRPDSPILLEQRAAVTSRRDVVVLRDPGLPTSSRARRKVDFCLGPVELAAAIREHRPCRLSGRFCAHTAEVALAIHHARGGMAETPVRSTFEPMAPMPWAL